MLKLNCGCGSKTMDGWVNIDNFDPSSFSGKTEGIIRHDLTNGIPFESDTVDVVFSEHFVEHMELRFIHNFIKESHRVLKPGGVFRMSTPDLKDICLNYVFGDMSAFRRLGMYAEEPAILVNQGLRDWGHKYILDKRQTENILLSVGFKDIEFVKHGQSRFEYLRGLETRPAALDFVVEAVK